MPQTKLMKLSQVSSVLGSDAPLDKPILDSKAQEQINELPRLREKFTKILNKFKKIETELNNILKEDFKFDLLNPSKLWINLTQEKLTKLEEKRDELQKILKNDFSDFDNDYLINDDNSLVKNLKEALPKIYLALNEINILTGFIVFAANNQLQPKSLESSNSINVDVINSPEAAMIILQTPSHLNEVSNENLQKLLENNAPLYKGLGSQLSNVFCRMISGIACMELLKRRNAQITHPDNKSVDDLDLKTLHPRMWIKTIKEQQSNSEPEQLALNLYLLTCMEQKINEKFNSLVEGKSKTPWQLGWLGSRYTINHAGTEYIVPKTIEKIYRKIQDAKDIPNYNRSIKNQISVMDKIFNEIDTLLSEKTNSENPILSAFINFLKLIIGRGRSNETQQTYNDFKEITQLKR